ncbi:hypothetical protein HOE91_03620 [archaeon]|jgi:hypothetical protein|nr:hypothetical protein [archaeon]MBT4440772.1 hypothetical protein [archaeon]
MAIYLVKNLVDERRREEWFQRRISFNEDERDLVGRYLEGIGFIPEGNGTHFRKGAEYVGVGSDTQIHIGEGTSQAILEEVIILSGADYYLTDEDHGSEYHPVED